MRPLCEGGARRLPVSSLAIRHINSLFGMIPAALRPIIVFFFFLYPGSSSESLMEFMGAIRGALPSTAAGESGSSALEVSRPCERGCNECWSRPGREATACIFICRKARTSLVSGCRCLLESRFCDLTRRLLIKQALGTGEEISHAYLSSLDQSERFRMYVSRMMSVSREICARYLFLVPLEDVELQFKIKHDCRANSKIIERKECLDLIYFLAVSCSWR